MNVFNININTQMVRAYLRKHMATYLLESWCQWNKSATHIHSAECTKGQILCNADVVAGEWCVRESMTERMSGRSACIQVSKICMCIVHCALCMKYNSRESYRKPKNLILKSSNGIALERVRINTLTHNAHMELNYLDNVACY